MQTQTKDEHEENIIVVVRVKPLSCEEGDRKCMTVDRNSLTIDVRTELKTFHFDYIANDTVRQEEIFEIAGRPLADACIQGNRGPRVW